MINNMNIELTEEQRNIAKQRILEIADSDSVIHDTTNNYDFIKKAANDIKNGVPIKEDILKAIISFILVLDLFEKK